MMAMMMKGMFMLFLSLAMGYVLCILAKKEQGVLKTVGYTFGISIIVLSLLCSLLCSEACDMKHKMMGQVGGKAWGMMTKHCPKMVR